MKIKEGCDNGPVEREIIDIYLSNQENLCRLPDPIAVFTLEQEPTEGYRRPTEMIDPLIGRPLYVRHTDIDIRRIPVLGIDLVTALGGDNLVRDEVIEKWLRLLNYDPFHRSMLFWKCDGSLEPLN